MFEDPRVKHLNTWKETTLAQGIKKKLITQPVVLNRTPANIVTIAPMCGEHTDEILRDAGYAEAESARFRREKIV